MSAELNLSSTQDGWTSYILSTKTPNRSPSTNQTMLSFSYVQKLALEYALIIWRCDSMCHHTKLVRIALKIVLIFFKI